MALAIQICAYLIALPLQLLVIRALLQGPYRRYPFVFVYAIAIFLTTAVEAPLFFSYYAGNRKVENALVNLYWIDEAVLQVLVYAVVISFLYYATAALRSRRIVRIALIGGAVLFAGVSFQMHYDPLTKHVGEWMTPWSRDLNFCSAILDLALWTLLIAARQKDHRLLMLSGALGIQFTGEAIGGSLRHLSQANRSALTTNIGDAVVVLTDLLFLYILWQTFREAKPKNGVRASKGE
ncbi:MAG: hypothetical protein LAQ69_49705 [Acidobacteriia bacterium]|nr:hypothetical protein [Terriglobia bacterium]